MTTWVAVLVVAAYASLAVELTVLHVRSVASSRSIWSAPPELVASYSPRYRRLFGWPLLAKLLVFGLPLLVIYGVYAYPLLVLAVGPDLLGDYLFATSRATDVLGVVLVAAGRALALRAALTIRGDNDQTGNSFRLHVAGPFRWSRNPGLLGMYLFAGGLWLTTPSATMLLGLAMYVLYMDFKVRMEEDFLSNKFGSSYAQYRLRAGRYLP